MAENRSEEESEAEKRIRQNAANKMVGPTEADSRMTATARNRRFQPRCRRHSTADNPGSVDGDIGLTNGAER